MEDNMINKENFTTLEQLGGRNRLAKMLGAYDFAFDNIENSIVFKFQGNTEINSVKVIYRYGNDTYRVIFYKYTYRNMDVKIVEELDGIYVDDLKRVIEDTINLCLSY
jgi:uncharacterized protein YerC